jgi:hypothetical protein
MRPVSRSLSVQQINRAKKHRPSWPTVLLPNDSLPQVLWRRAILRLCTAGVCYRRKRHVCSHGTYSITTFRLVNEFFLTFRPASVRSGGVSLTVYSITTCAVRLAARAGSGYKRGFSWKRMRRDFDDIARATAVAGRGPPGSTTWYAC